TGGTGYPWTNPFALDPNNSDMMYLGGGHILWRNNDLSSIPLDDNQSPTSIGWDDLSATMLPGNSPYGSSSAITAIGVSTYPPNRVYYGTDDGMLFRLDNADTGNHKPTAIWSGKGFPANALVNSIAVDPNNADSVIICFANFEVQSLFLSTNGGTTWKPIGGNLEEYPNGSGNGPSVRAAAILPVGDGMIYLVGTSTGVYSTNKLNGMSTVWSLEGASTIGNDIVNALDVRPSDGYVAVGSCGSGAFTATFTSANSSVSNTQPQPAQLTLEPNYPNPYSSVTHFEFKVAEAGVVSLAVYDEKGVIVKSLLSEEIEPGTYTTEWNSSSIPSGSYICKLSENGQTVSRLLSIER
ncbi:MAG TPA: T9SS type A sorting domain-containing protein, partial [Candidatus Kapabacteria bacterium]|nr:T9SS type A sorting domain-containing protein [Candidatus Kapabacteria bacterium]